MLAVSEKAQIHALQDVRQIFRQPTAKRPRTQSCVQIRPLHHNRKSIALRRSKPLNISRQVAEKPGHDFYSMARHSLAQMRCKKRLKMKGRKSAS